MNPNDNVFENDDNDDYRNIIQPPRPNKRRRRRQYASFQNNDSDHDSDDDNDDDSSDDDDDHNIQQKQDHYREQQRNMNLYGSFLVNDNDEYNDDKYNNNNNVEDRKQKPPTKKVPHHNHNNNFVPNAPPLFVGATIPTTTTTTKTTAPNTTTTNENHNIIQTSSSPTTTTIPINQSSKHVKEKEEVDEHDLLRNVTTTTTTTRSSHNKDIRSTGGIAKTDSLLPRTFTTSTTTTTNTNTTIPPNDTTTTTNSNDTANAKFYALLQQSRRNNHRSNNNSNNNNSNNHYHPPNHQSQSNHNNVNSNNNNNNNTQWKPPPPIPIPIPIPIPTPKSGPKIGIWEKHTKGIGMKLLTKMGYSGTGGLLAGAKRRRPQQQQSQEGGEDKEIADYNNNNTTTTHSTTATTTNDDDENIQQPTSVLPRMGIAVPVPIKIRPNNLGLGYGNFKEATSISLNRKSSSSSSQPQPQYRKQQQQRQHSNHNNANTREDNDDDDDVTSSTMSTMQQQLWKRYNNKNNHNRKNQDGTNLARTRIVSHDHKKDHENDINVTTTDTTTPNMTILDLRGPTPSMVSPMEISSTVDRSKFKEMNAQQKSLPDDADRVILQDELLQNVTQLCHSTYAYQVQNIQYQMDHVQQQQRTLQKEYDEDIKNIQLLQERQKKLQHVLNIFEQMETIVQDNTGSKNHWNTIKMEDRLVSAMEQLQAIQQLILPLLEAFTLEERQQLHLSSKLLPTIIGTMVQQSILDQWDPFVRNQDYTQSKMILRSILLLVHNDSNTTSSSSNNENIDIPPPPPSSSYDDDMYQIRYTLIQNYILPKFQFLYESSHWDPMNDEQEIGLNLYEWFIDILRHETSSINPVQPLNTDSTTNDNNNNNNNEDEVLFQTVEKNESTGTILANMVQKQLIHPVVYNKLLRILNHDWKPKWDEQNGFVHRPDLWIIPWLPYIATDKSLMPTLVSDCKRAVRHAISYLHRTIPQNQNDIYIQICLQSLRGWIGILKMDTLHNIMSAASVTSRLAQYLSHCTIHIDEMTSKSLPATGSEYNDHHWKDALRLLFQYHQLQLLSDVQFLSLFEGELLPHWADTIYQYMNDMNERGNAEVNDDSKVIENVCRVYIIWKHHIFGGMNELPGIDANIVGTLNDAITVTPSNILLRNDVPICECFYTVLRMVQAYYKAIHSAATTETTSNVENDTIPFNAMRISTPGYRIVYQRRKDQMKQQASDDLLRMNLSGIARKTTSTSTGTKNATSDSVLEAQVRLHQSQSKDTVFQRGGIGPSFRDVVTEFAREQDLLFQPRLNSGNNSNHPTTTTKDGKPIYLFGTIPIYLDHNVAYAYTKATTTTTTTNRVWQPMSLQEIAKLAKQNVSEPVQE